jgi:hypothetical protein
MRIRIQCLCVDARDPASIASFWESALGAARVSVGQTAEATWVVLADLEGNGFCVLTALQP